MRFNREGDDECGQSNPPLRPHLSQAIINPRGHELPPKKFALLALYSKSVLGRSTDAHVLRHGYAQDRMIELQELGHFRPDIVTEYLR